MILKNIFTKSEAIFRFSFDSKRLSNQAIPNLTEQRNAYKKKILGG